MGSNQDQTTSVGDGQPDCVLLIDWENFKYSLVNNGQTPSLSAIREIAERQGRVVLARAYADWQEHRDDAASLYAAGIEPVYVPATLHPGDDGQVRRWKNSVDVKLTADCVDLAYRLPNVRVFILVSGDQDFLHVVNTLRPTGRRVIGIGLSWSTSRRLAERVDELVLYDEVAGVKAEEPATEWVDDLSKDDRAAVEAALEHLRRSAPSDAVDDDVWRRGLIKVIETVRAARQAEEPLLLSNVGVVLQKELREHDYRRAFKGRLREVAKALEVAGLVKVVTQGLVDWLYLPDEVVSSTTAQEPDETGFLTGAGMGWADLEDGQKQLILSNVRNFRRSPGIIFLTFNQIRNQVENAVPGLSGVPVQRVVTDMLNSGLLVEAGERTDFSPITGAYYSFRTFELAD